MRTFYVTTPIYYVNDLPHIGHIYTTTVADSLARYRRLAGSDVRFLTGTDEHGQNIERAAKREGIAPLALADRVVSRYYELRELMGFSNDDFIRTTEERHRLGVDEIIRRLEGQGDLYSATHEGWYCTACENFYTEKELSPGQLCPVHGTPVEWKSEENVFFRLSKYQEPLLDWYAKNPAAVRPASRLNEVRSFVESGLRDLSVSRANLEWGLPFPGRPGQTVYVWLDALTNYVSALGFGREGEEAALYERYWEHGDVRLHIVGKDILRFHAVYWPAFLMSAGLPLPTTVWAHGWWLRDGRKVSKSAGNLVRPDELLQRFGSDGLRYFLLRDMVFGQDASFSDEGFIDRYNSDLANDLGNTVSRVVTLSRKAFGGRTPPVHCVDNPLIEVAGRVVPEYQVAMEELAFSRALEALWRLLAETNQYLVSRAPWNLIKTEGPTERLSRVLWNGLEAVRVVATGLLPIMPRAAAEVLAAVGSPELPTSLNAMTWGRTPNDRELPEPYPIFPRIDKEAYLGEAAQKPAPEAPGKTGQGKTRQTGGEKAGPEKTGQAKTSEAKTAAPAAKTSAPEEKPLISIDQFFETELKVATVVAAEPVPKSSKLLKLSLDLGEETRTVVSGIASRYQPADLLGKQVILVANLQPAKLMGIESQGMVLAASQDGLPILLHPGAAVPPGTRVK
ncbi:MAG TPA: methionine--tRNA ligase [Thermoanaerobaculia bacterium]|nr:methionine--tRNA ligase [Thermoanaerobaculia bacterium]